MGIITIHNNIIIFYAQQGCNYFIKIYSKFNNIVKYYYIYKKFFSGSSFQCHIILQKSL